MDPVEIILIFIVGIVAGFVNVVGGGGSLISLPALIFVGLPSAVANGTNRVALMVQNLVALHYFRGSGYFYPKLSVMLAIPAVIGSIVGAKFAIALSDDMFNTVLAVIMIVVAVLVIVRPEKYFMQKEKEPAAENSKDNGEKPGVRPADGHPAAGTSPAANADDELEGYSRVRLALAALAFFGVGFYGGFIQAGVGFIIIAVLALITGMSLVKINSLKVFVTAIYILSSLLIFVFSGNVHWLFGLILAGGNAIGAYYGGVFTVKKGDKWIRVFLVVSVTIMAGKLLGVESLFGL